MELRPASSASSGYREQTLFAVSTGVPVLGTFELWLHYYHIAAGAVDVARPAEALIGVYACRT